MSSANSSNQSTALITGAGSGIGRATAELFLRENWNVILVGRRIEPLLEVAKIKPTHATAISCDMSSATSVTELASRLRSDTSLRCIVNNAGIFERRSLLESDDVLWRKQFETNLLGPVRLARELAPVLVKNGGGVIVNVSSTLGIKPVAGTGAYSAVKAAMINWTKTLALELAPDKVRVNCVCPGLVDTPIHSFHSETTKEALETRKFMQTLQPLGRIGKPEEVAHAIYHFASPGSEWTTGSVLSVDGGIGLV